MNKTTVVLFSILGHSALQPKVVSNKPDPRVPHNLTLVFPSICGQTFSRDDKFRKILNDRNKTLSWLLNSNNQKEIFKANKEYTDQSIDFFNAPNSKIKLTHGIYAPPFNIKHPTHNSNVNINKVLNGSTANLSYLLEMLSLSIPAGGHGIVIGLFCRGTNYGNNSNKGKRKRNVTTLFNYPGALYPKRIVSSEHFGNMANKLRPTPLSTKMPNFHYSRANNPLRERGSLTPYSIALKKHKEAKNNTIKSNNRQLVSPVKSKTLVRFKVK